MSTFGCYPKRVKTRKPHCCQTCNRTIPKGNIAHHTSGMYSGDWQHWYMCDFCYELNYDLDDFITGEEFISWMFEQEFWKCPKCIEKGETCWNTPEWDWSDDEESILFECDCCGHKWSKHIGWKKESNNES